MTNCSFQTKHGKVSFRAKKCNGTRTPAKKAPAKKAPAKKAPAKTPPAKTSPAKKAAPAKKAPAPAPAPTRRSSRAGRTPMGRYV